jgi:hypothetical protein
MLVDSSFCLRASRRWLPVLAMVAASAWSPTFGQSPLPGGGAVVPQMDGNSAPVPGLDITNVTSPPQAHGFVSGVPAANSKYAQLPLNIFDAKSRMSELRTMANAGRPQEVLEAVNRLSEWLGDMCDAHNRMAAVYAKHGETKLQAIAERQAVQKFSQVRNQAQLLKAEMLMQQHRFPEALTPLVDICIAEPTSATGQAAYGKLKELGFAEDPTAEAVAAANASEGGEPAKHASPVKTSSASASAQPIRRIR